MLVGLCSSYAEGPLVQAAVRSLIEACDQVVVYEGPAGPPLDGVPATDFGIWEGASNLRIHHGRWRTDAKKRTAMVKWCQEKYAPPIWGCWVDGDEVLCNGEYLRDWIQQLLWLEETDPLDAPRAGFPIPLVEMDGRVNVCRAKVIRIDLIDEYVVSSSGIRFKGGVTMAEGNLPVKLSEWFADRAGPMTNDDALFIPPPLPCEPFLLHRSSLRHPLRRGLRMSDQEASELKRMGVL